ncbi:hypothetical protein [Dinghuibacter silviterrae]|nr:hypothetical protein [Dinghuibacter silviterrae]
MFAVDGTSSLVPATEDKKPLVSEANLRIDGELKPPTSGITAARASGRR